MGVEAVTGDSETTDNRGEGGIGSGEDGGIGSGEDGGVGLGEGRSEAGGCTTTTCASCS